MIHEPIELINMDELMEIMDGNGELLKECFEDFCDHYPKMLMAIKEAIDTGNAHNLQFAAHKFKGNLQCLAVKQAADIANQLETMGEKADLSHAGDIFHFLQKECDRLRDFMAQYAG